MKPAWTNTKMPAIGIALLILPFTASAWSGDPWGNITRATIKSNADLMIDSTWVPKNTFTNFQEGSTYYTFTQGVTYTGEAYSQNSPQENWSQFYILATNTSGGSVGYGNDCSGFVSICWKLPAREVTATFESRLGTHWISLGDIGSAASVPLLPGDALNYPGTHIVMFLDYESGGIRTMEQNLNTAQRRVRSYSNLTNYRPIRRLQILEDKAISLGGNLAFGSVLVGTNAQRTLTIHNAGISNLTVTNLSCPAGFSGNWSGTIAAGGSTNVAITFSPTAMMPYGGNLAVNSNATSGTNTLAISGNGTTAMAQLMILLPGEIPAYGVAPGKTGSPNAEYATVGYPVTVAVLDANYNLVTNAADMVGVSSSVGGDSLPANAALAGGTQTFTLTNNTVGSATLTATNVTQGPAMATGSSTVTVGINDTTTTLASSANPASEGQDITFTATVGGAGVKTGTVAFDNGFAVIGTAAVSGSTATLTISGGAGTNAITATYNGDANNNGSTSSPLAQGINAGGMVPYPPARLMEEGFDYAVQTIPTNGVGLWAISQSSTVVGIIAGDLAGDTSPALKDLPNSASPAAHLVLGASPSTDREFHRSFGNAVTSGPVYFSFLLHNGFGVTNLDEVIFIMTATNGTPNTNGSLGAVMVTNGSVYYPDPLTLHAKTNNGAANSYQLGVERLGGTTVWATNALTSGASGGTYLVVLKYAFGGTCSLFLDPTPGSTEPMPSATTAAGGTESNNVGRVVFYEGLNPRTSGIARATNALDGYNYDVMRADTNWHTVTPAAGAAGLGAAKLVFSSAAQTNGVNQTSALMTVTLEDQSNHVFTATADTEVSLNSDSDSGAFLAADGATVIISVTISSGQSTATFYYNDGVAGTPTITAASGLLTSATQRETVYAPPANGQMTTVTGLGPCEACMEFHGVPGAQYHVQRSTDLRTWTSPGEVVTADGSGNINYSDTNAPVGEAYYKLAP